MTFEGMDMDGPVLFTFNGDTEMNGNTVIEGIATADLFIGDGGGFTNLPTPSLAFSDLSTTPTTLAGYGITDGFSGNYSDVNDRPFAYDPVKKLMYSVLANATGENSFAVNQGTTSSGVNSSSFGMNSTASGYNSFVAGFNNTASGQTTTAFGYNTNAVGVNSFAAGAANNSIGESSTSLGQLSTSQGAFSLAANIETTAIGIGSTALGKGTIAGEYASLVIGHYNVQTSYGVSQHDNLNVAFAIGNGTDDTNRSNAFSVKFDGTTNVSGSVTATSFIGDGSQLTNLPSSGADSPFSYNSNEAGGIEVANYTTASGSRAFAVGADSQASGNYSTSMGRGTIASGDDSTAMGANTEASGIYYSYGRGQ